MGYNKRLEQLMLTDINMFDTCDKIIMYSSDRENQQNIDEHT